MILGFRSCTCLVPVVRIMNYCGVAAFQLVYTYSTGVYLTKVSEDRT